KHGVAPVTADTALDILQSVVLNAAEPCAAWATITTFCLLDLARRQGVACLMSGLGADEIFGGYDHFRGAYVRYLNLLRRSPDLLFANFEPLARQLGVEVSYPFLDPDVVRLAAGLAVESRYCTPQGQFSRRLRDLQPQFKHALLTLARDRVPEAILNRPRKS